MLYLVLEALGIKDESSEFAASHVGVSSGLVTILRAFPFHASQQQVYLPQDLMRKHAVPPQAVLRGPSNETELKALRDCVFDVASQAYGHLDKARALEYSPQAIHALMPAVRSAMFLETLRQVDFNPRHEDLHKQSSQIKYQLNLLHARWTKKI
jgi:phytoene/squalene synthetase